MQVLRLIYHGSRAVAVGLTCFSPFEHYLSSRDAVHASDLRFLSRILYIAGLMKTCLYLLKAFEAVLSSKITSTQKKSRKKNPATGSQSMVKK